MNAEMDYAFKKLEDAVSTLNEGVLRAEDELQRDGVIQRFEYSFETMWKTFKVFLLDLGVDVKTPKDALKEAFRLEWISDERLYLQMLKDRNKTSHMYNKQVADDIFKNIKSEYIFAMKDVVEYLRSF